MNEFEADCWQRMDDCRRYFGRARFEWSDELHRTSTAWAQHLADGGALSHSSMRDLLYGHDRTWRRVAENVGVGGDVKGVFDAWVRSPMHFKNLLELVFNRSACAVVQNDKGLWLVQHFAHVR